MTEMEVTKGYGNFSNSINIIQRVANFNASSHALPHALLYIFSQFKWIGHNTKRYHNFKVLLHALPYIFSQFNIGSP